MRLDEIEEIVMKQVMNTGPGRLNDFRLLSQDKNFSLEVTYERKSQFPSGNSTATRAERSAQHNS
jgi:hypothetical protein